MRVHFLLPGLEVSGGVLCILQHARGLRARGHDVRVLVSTPWTDQVRQRLPGAVRDVPLELHSGGVLPEADIQIATHHSTALSVAQSPGRLRAQFVQHVELIFGVGSPQANLLAPFIRMTYALPLYRITNSLWAQATLARLTGERPDRAVNAVSLPVDDASDEIVFRPRIVSFVHPAVWKGTQDAFDAMCLARAMAPELDLQWVVFGAGAVPEAPWIENHGIVAHDALPAIYRSAAALLFTSWAESYPLPPIEAMAAGCPVVTTPYGVEDYVVPDENAVVIPPRDPIAAATALVNLLRAPIARRKSLMDAGRATARQHTWERAVTTFEQALFRGLSAPAPPDVTGDLLRTLDIPVLGR
ncbi:MAG: glycosyltransferase family 4 protein [Clostridia bacterium]